MGLITFLTGLLLLVDCCAWRIVRLPLESFFLTHVFFISMVLVSCAGYVCVPLLDIVCVNQIVQTEWPNSHSLKKRTPTMGGLFLVPIGVFVALFKVRFSSTEVLGAAMATLAYATVGFLDDSLSLSKSHYYGLSSKVKFLLEASFQSILFVSLNLVNNLICHFRSQVLFILLIITGSGWDHLLTVVGVHQYTVTLWHVYLLVTNLINIYLMVTNIAELLLNI